jgi:hypothetical protein
VSFPLTDRTLPKLERRMISHGTPVTPETRVGLRDMLRRCELILLDRAAPRFYLSSLDPGVGKTTATIVLLEEILADLEHRPAGVLICLSTTQQIVDMVGAANLATLDFAVLTSDTAFNYGLSTTLPQAAPVLFTTQQMVASRCSSRQFSQVSEFLYAGKPRKLRIWDESMLPAQALTLNADEITRLLLPLRPVSPGPLMAMLSGLASTALARRDGDVLPVPQLASGLFSATNGHPSLTEQDKDIIDRLVTIAGTTVRVRKEFRGSSRGHSSAGGRSTILVGRGRELPEDLAPVVILDASGRIRQTYELWQQERHTLTWLKPAVRDYSKLTVHVWNRGAGKSSIYSKAVYPQILSTLQSTITSRPRTRWLVITHKTRGRDNLAKDLQRLAATSQASYLTWGRHRGSNSYSACDGVVLGGLWYQPKSHFESLIHVASSSFPAVSPASAADIQEMCRTELLDGIFQAACRSGIRSGNQQPCHLYLMAAPKSGVRKSLNTLFPGCTVVDWVPAAVAKMPLRAQQAFDTIDRALPFPGATITFKSVWRSLGMKSQQFTQSIRPNELFQAALAAKGITEIGGNRRKNAFQRMLPISVPVRAQTGAGNMMGFMTRIAA